MDQIAATSLIQRAAACGTLLRHFAWVAIPVVTVVTERHLLGSSRVTGCTAAGVFWDALHRVMIITCLTWAVCLSELLTGKRSVLLIVGFLLNLAGALPWLMVPLAHLSR